MQAPASAPANRAGLKHARAEGDGGHDEHDHHDRARGQTVKPVGEVHGVAEPHEQDKAVDKVEPGNGDAVAHGHHRGEHAQIEGGHKRDLHGGLDAEQVHRHQHENGSDEKLADQLRLGREPERSLVGHLRGIIDEPEDTGGHRGAEQKPQLRGRGAHRGEQGEDDDGDEHDDAAHSGVPCFTRWLWGPSARTCWPMWLVFRKRIQAGMSTMVITMAMATPRKIMNVG